MPTTITTESSRPIIKSHTIAAAAALAVAACAASPAAAAGRVDHIRGKILGTTLTSLDVGSAAVDDVHLDMAREPFVVIAERSEIGAVHVGDFVSVVFAGSAAAPRAHSVTIVPDTAHVFESGRRPWDLPGQKSTIVNGRVSDVAASGGNTLLTVAYRGGFQRVTIAPPTPVIALRAGSRLALAEAHSVFVFAKPPTSLLTDSVQSVIVGDGALVLPF